MAQQPNQIDVQKLLHSYETHIGQLQGQVIRLTILNEELEKNLEEVTKLVEEKAAEGQLDREVES
jgi:hypothetical protein